MITPLTDLQLDEVTNLAAESELDHETALARALELIKLRKLVEACRKRHPYAALDELPARGEEQAWYRAKIRASLKAPIAGADVPDLVTLAQRES